MEPQNRSLLQRARWDRIFGALIILVLIIILLVTLCKSCSREKKPAEDAFANMETLVEETQAPTQAPTDNSMAVFLSPSTQYDNIYACDGVTTEAVAMIDLAKRVRDLLEADGYTVYMCGEEDSIKEKVTQGNALKCGAYVALHTNSGGESGYGQGTECYYNSQLAGSYELAENIYNRVAELTPTEDRGLKDETQRDLYELLNNHGACCLLEAEFHDIDEYSQWILDNKDELAKAIKEGIVAYLKNSVVNEQPEEEDPTGEEIEYEGEDP
ncbi:MAG: N-acetylmuramoyl-L-alanine amidase [Oscillospiraceae bacterium]|nr:N-acetylmuramoyl-L-alanine amidase [Oscillospiraceae bacterium]